MGKELLNVIRYMCDDFIYRKGINPTKIIINFEYLELILSQETQYVRCKFEGTEFIYSILGMEITRTPENVIQIS